MASPLKALTWTISAALHAGLVLSMITFAAGSRSYEAGDGSDLFHVEQGIALEGLSQIGTPSEIVETVRETPREAQAAQVAETRPVEETPPETVPVTEPPPEVIEKSEVITAKAEQVEQQEILRDTPKEVVRPQEIAAADPIAPAVATEETTVATKQSGGDPTVRLAYLGKLRSRIEARKVNPNSREQGTVVVRFTVDAGGKLVSREVATSSGSKLLDDAALAAVERASPYPPFPTGLGQASLVVNVPFRFMTR